MSNEQMEYATKECPVCKTRLFADMDTCYGCLHDFREDPIVEQVFDVGEPYDFCEYGEERQDALAAMPPSADAKAAWTLRVELQEGDSPARTWNVELTPSC